MWTHKDGKCNALDDKDKAASNPYRYPIGSAPGDVIHHPEKFDTIFTPGTTLHRIFDEIIPLIMGSLIMFFLVSTITYLCFSILRLFYLDTLKPYKMKTLKNLGKHRHYFRNRDDPDKRQVKRWKKILPTMNTKEENEEPTTIRLVEKQKRKTPPDLVHPLGQKLSYTSPPLHHFGPAGGVTAADAGYPHVIDLLNAGNLKKVDQFPSKISKMFVEGTGRAVSKIPVAVNRRGGPWIWNPNWYKRQLVDEGETGKAVFKLESTRSKLNVTASQQFLPPPVARHVETETNPLSTIPMSEPYHKPIGVQANPVPLKSPTAADIPQSGNRDRPPTHKSHTLSRTRLMEQYTFLPEKSSIFTEIPKMGKSSYKQQLMILRGGPRRDSASIKKIKLRKSWERRSWDK